ncbi:MAG: hypothetical protein LBU64_14650 [Planctomycetota bacterium]|jgi:hypothetical protein|nr:hypothetical protein [Planctomycetota bacterium]
MSRSLRPSRLNPVYLFRRHAGTLFLFSALGLFPGLVYRDLFQPSRQTGAAGLTLSVVPAGGGFAWDAGLAKWRSLPESEADRGLLNNNLRRLVKLSAVPGAIPEGGDFSTRLSRFEAPASYSRSLLPGWLTALAGWEAAPGLRDFVLNLDFQTLAAVIGDLSPPAGIAAWDFPGLESPEPEGGPAASLTVETGGGDRSFQVFRRLHEYLSPGREEAGAREIWLFAAEEAIRRLELETRIPGGGGFGASARRELIREFLAMPVLIANGLYLDVPPGRENDAFLKKYPEWDNLWLNGASLEIIPSRASGRLIARVERELRPLAPPRNTSVTRLAPLAAAVLLSHISVREVKARESEGENEPPAEPVGQEIPGGAGDEAGSAPGGKDETAPAGTETVDSVDRREEEAREAVIELEKSRRRIMGTRDAARLGLGGAREREGRLTVELATARDRAERLGERYEAARLEAETRRRGVPREPAGLLRIRKAVLARLGRLLEYCSEEHPFVKRSRRELAAVDLLIADQVRRGGAPGEPETEEIRLAGLKSEREAAAGIAAGLEERRRRSSAEIESFLAALVPLEKELADLEIKLISAREELELSRFRPRAAETAAARPPPAEAPEPAPRSEPPPMPEEIPATAVFPSGFPEIIEDGLIRPDWRLPGLGLLLGAALGAILAGLREIWPVRFFDVFEARRLLEAPVQLVLPAYDPGSLRRAAKSMEGMLRGSGNQLLFIPAPIEVVEPKPIAKRGRLARKRRFPRLLPWLAGLLALAAAFQAHRLADSDFARLGGELPEFRAVQATAEGG